MQYVIHVRTITLRSLNCWSEAAAATVFNSTRFLILHVSPGR